MHEQDVQSEHEGLNEQKVLVDNAHFETVLASLKENIQKVDHKTVEIQFYDIILDSFNSLIYAPFIMFALYLGIEFIPFSFPLGREAIKLLPFIIVGRHVLYKSKVPTDYFIHRNIRREINSLVTSLTDTNITMTQCDEMLQKEGIKIKRYQQAHCRKLIDIRNIKIKIMDREKNKIKDGTLRSKDEVKKIWKDVKKEIKKIDDNEIFCDISYLNEEKIEKLKKNYLNKKKLCWTL